MGKTAQEYLELALQSKNLEEKLEYCTKYLEINPEDYNLWEYKSTICKYLGNEKCQSECVSKAIEGRSSELDDGGYEYRVAIFLLTFPGSERKEKKKEAIESLNELLKKNLDFTDGWLLKGELLVQLKRFKEALKCFDRVLEFESDKVIRTKIWTNKANALALKEKNAGENKDKILNCCKKALDIDPANLEAWVAKANYLDLVLKEYEEAIKCYNEVINILKKDTETDFNWFNMAKQSKILAEEKKSKKQSGKETKNEKQKNYEKSGGCLISLLGLILLILGIIGFGV